MARVLLLDDSAAVRGLVQQWLTDAGHEVVPLCSGHGARAHLRRGDIELVITDIFMPDVDGLEILRLVRQEAPQLPCIAISSAPHRLDLLGTARAFGAAVTLRKPFQAPQLLAAIRAAFAQSASQPVSDSSGPTS